MIDPAHLSPWLLLMAPLMIVIAYTVFGLSGFGSTVIAIPVLAHFLPVTFLVPMMAVLDLFSSAFLGARGREHVAKQELKWLIPCMLAGFLLGATVLVSVPDRYLRVALGVFTVAVGVNSIVNPVLHRTISRWWVVPSGLIGGSIATIFGAGGPIYATYLSGRHGKTRFTPATRAISLVATLRSPCISTTSGSALSVSITRVFTTSCSGTPRALDETPVPPCST